MPQKNNQASPTIKVVALQVSMSGTYEKMNAMSGVKNDPKDPTNDIAVIAQRLDFGQISINVDPATGTSPPTPNPAMNANTTSIG